MEIKTLEFKDEKLYLIDQRKLPNSFEIFVCENYTDVDFAIKDMVVRGAPAIGASGAYGVVLGAKEYKHLDKKDFLEKMKEVSNTLNKSRPTAVNLMWGIKRMENIIEENKELSPVEIYEKLKEEGNNIAKEDVKINKAMGEYGNTLVPEKATILTHCNAGALATVEYGTALGVIRSAFYSGKDIFVYVDETRPRLQGAKLTSWELVKENIPCKLISDSVAATLIRDGKIDLIVVGADRIATNGDTANKIGTFMLSVVAKTYNIPFYIAAPISTIDFNIETGKEIVIEERDDEEVTHIQGVRIAPEEIEAYNPAFDVTPNENITAIITEKGIINPPFKENILKLRS
ncbi:S-methyl-5-thioribose-1-phosphate isomerase [Anaerosalibacter massiliensis]|uniref:Methylthioribose-1-phosphate isomerase n=1 Tax=Anaerosalibacter massiliensis TaxID=1347392 RepID=A0A9X2MIH2_9FIRM|nr:S-methyl-5-thioribose-1-phosphate isomerase [Anaerosalibacter massiliensis]MCR2044660.1 S-methyl-5-thioribose-1-phosphate isomerase [Anaerosalibacter massiliensis]